MPVYLEEEGHFDAEDLPKFKMNAKTEVREKWGPETEFVFTCNEDFGEGRILCMEVKVERIFQRRCGTIDPSASEEEAEDDENETGPDS
ncbi:hypothetical protein AAVH_13346 [Aphelenchoides avenae]|nr:hypothetical protein AAVH_13346 [Aphelenchus avenae]